MATRSETSFTRTGPVSPAAMGTQSGMASATKTPSGHTRAICASTVKGTYVYDMAGNNIGYVEDIVLDKMSNEIMFAIVAFGGFLGIGEKYHALPWSQLDYNEEKEGYVVSLTREALENAPAYEKADLLKDTAFIRESSNSYYSANN